MGQPERLGTWPKRIVVFGKTRADDIYYKNVVMGKNGMMHYNGGFATRYPVPESAYLCPEQVVNITGAGDTYAGALYLYLMLGHSVSDAHILANQLVRIKLLRLDPNVAHLL